MRGWGVGGMILPYLPCFTWLLLLYGSIEFLIFLKQSSWPKTMYAKHWRKLAWATFLGNFPILLVQQFCGALMNSCLCEYATVFSMKNKFQPVILAFYFDLGPPFYFLKWNCFFSTFKPVLNEYVTISNTYCHGKCVLSYKLKDFL